MNTSSSQGCGENSSSNMLNSRFWFDMYQRLKEEMSVERRGYLDQQSS